MHSSILNFHFLSLPNSQPYLSWFLLLTIIFPCCLHFKNFLPHPKITLDVFTFVGQPLSSSSIALTKRQTFNFHSQVAPAPPFSKLPPLFYPYFFYPTIRAQVLLRGSPPFVSNNNVYENLHVGNHRHHLLMILPPFSKRIVDLNVS